MKPGDFFEKHQVVCGLVVFLVWLMAMGLTVGAVVYQTVTHINIEVENP